MIEKNLIKKKLNEILKLLEWKIINIKNKFFKNIFIKFKLKLNFFHLEKYIDFYEVNFLNFLYFYY